ncbi:MAG: MFS transporter [Eubacteriales bacterium]
MIGLLLAIIYLAFISLGLPDSLLGSAWPSMYREFSIPISYAGIISMIIAFGTIVSSLMSDRLTRKFDAGKVTAASVLTTAVALLGFSVSNSFPALCLWAIPYGLGAGSVDAALNNYVALHFASRHMSWLHCMWGVGASVGPYIMGFAIDRGQGWNMGYRYISIIQFVLSAVIIISLPLWNKGNTSEAEEKKQSSEDKNKTSPLTLPEIFRIPGAKEIMISFFCYCALEQTTSLWASSYLVLVHGISAETAAFFASLFFIGITAGRAVSGFMTFRFNDTQMVRIGQGIVLLGIILLILPFGNAVALTGLILVGLGCAPIYPSIIHSTPEHFGADKSQAVIGVEMASAYVGTCLMPPLFGLIAEHISIYLFPVYLLVILILMFIMFGKMLQKAIFSHSFDAARSRLAR